MRVWTTTLIAVTLAATAMLAFKQGRRTIPVPAPDLSAMSDLREQLAQLQRRVNNDESTTGYLNDDIARIHKIKEASPTVSTEARPAQPPLPMPTPAQQVERFEKHFANIDALRGKTEDFDLDSKLSAALADTPPELATLKSATVDRVNCGNQFCRVELTFPGAGAARHGQTELRIQLGPLVHNFTSYCEPDSNHLYAYLSVGDQRLPEFPKQE